MEHWVGLFIAWLVRDSFTAVVQNADFIFRNTTGEVFFILIQFSDTS